MVSHCTKISFPEGLINPVPGSHDFPTSSSCYIPQAFFLFCKHSWACKLVSAPGPLFLFLSTWNTLPLSFVGLVSLRYSVLRSPPKRSLPWPLFLSGRCFILLMLVMTYGFTFIGLVFYHQTLNTRIKVRHLSACSLSYIQGLANSRK